MLNRRSVFGLLYVPVAAGFGLLTSTSVLANLPTASSGLFFLCQSMMAFALLLDLGLLVIGTREIAFSSGRALAKSDSTYDGTEVLETFYKFRDARVFTIASGVGVLLLIATGYFLFPKLGMRENLLAFGLCLIASLMVLTSYTYQAFLEGSGNYHIDRIASTISVILTGSLISAAAFFTRSFFWVIAAWYIGQAVMLFLKMRCAFRINSRIHNDFHLSFARARSTFYQSFSLSLMQIGAALTKYAQYPVITGFLGVSQLGPYFFVVRISSTMDQAISVLSASQRATFSTSYARGDFMAALGILRSVILGVIVLSVFTAVVIAFVLPNLIVYWFRGADFSNVPFLIIGADLVMMCCSGTMSQFVIASGRNPFAKVVLATGGVTSLLLFLLIPRYGLTGAALAQFSSNAIISFSVSAFEFLKLDRDLVRGRWS